MHLLLMGNEKRDVLEALRDWLLEAWLDSIDWDMATLLEAVERGLPEDWAAAIEQQSGGRVPVKAWPHVIKRPNIASRMGKPFALRPGKPHVDTTGFSTGAKIGLAMSRRKHPAQLTLSKQGITISALHREIQKMGWDYTRSTVSAWFGEGSYNRAIPEEIVDFLHRKYGIAKDSWQKVLQKD